MRYDWNRGLRIICPICGAAVDHFCDILLNRSATHPSGRSKDEWLHRARLDLAHVSDVGTVLTGER